MKKMKFCVSGMTCSACSARVERTVKKLSGVNKVEVNLLTNNMQVEFAEEKISPADIIEAVENAGYGASLDDKHQQSKQIKISDNKTDGSKKRLILSIILLVFIMLIGMYDMFSTHFGIAYPNIFVENFIGEKNAIAFSFSQFILLLPILVLNRNYFQKGFGNLLKASPSMDSLVAMGASAATIFGIFAIFKIGYGLGHADLIMVREYSQNLYFESAGMILTLISIGKYLEAKAKKSTTDSIQALMKLAPQRAILLRDGVEQEVLVEDIEVGNIVIVRKGQLVPVDGVIIRGDASIDEAVITGESIPLDKSIGDKVISGTMLINGYIEFEAQKVGENSTINQIIRLVEEASSSKAPIARLADKISAIFVPTVICISLLAGAFWLYSGESIEFVFSIMVSVLIISCPCALGLATPVAIMVGIGKGAENGVLIRSGEALEVAHRVDTVIFDKTGTITYGKPHITDIYAINMSSADFIRLAGSIEKYSEHPLAKPIANYAKANGIAFLYVEEFNNSYGLGLSAKIDGVEYYAGNEELLIKKNILLDTENKSLIASLRREGKTPLLFANSNELIGIIAVLDVEKDSSIQAIRLLREENTKTIMLTGDSDAVASEIAKRVGIDEYVANVYPADKEKMIADLQEKGKKIAMVGDGVNDAVALARADVGIAIGRGADIAVEEADVVLVRNNLLDVVNSIKLSRAVIRNIKENLFWAFFYNSIGIPLAAGVLYPFLGIKLSPMIGALAMSMSSICVVLNALRLKRHVFLTSSPEENTNDMTSEPCIRELNINIVNDLQEGEKEKMKIILKIEGMMCKHCQKHVRDALAKMENVAGVMVDLDKSVATVVTNKDIPSEEFARVIKEAGYELVGKE